MSTRVHCRMKTKEKENTKLESVLLPNVSMQHTRLDYYQVAEALNSSEPYRHDPCGPSCCQASGELR